MVLLQSSALYLLLVVLLCYIVFYIYKRWQSKKLLLLGKPILVNKLIQNKSKLSSINNTFFLIGLALLCLALADPAKKDNSKNIQTNSRDVIIALDLSNSMNATDIAPSRLIQAKQLIDALCNNNTDNKIGLVVFAGNAYISVPLTPDAASVKMSLATLETSSIPAQGTNIAQGLLRSIDCFNTKQVSSKCIVLITDGENHETALDDAIEQCSKANIHLVVVGIGSANGSTIPDEISGNPKLDEQGNQVISTVNDEVLLKITNMAKGSLINFSNTSTTSAEIFDIIKDLPKLGTTQNNVTNYTHYYSLLTLPALLLLYLSIMGIPIIKKNKNIISVIFILMLSNKATMAQTNNFVQGNNWYTKKDYDKARQAYLQALENKRYTDSQQAIINYNVGNTYAKQKQWDKAIDYYTKALIKNPRDADARYNLVYAKKQLKQQQEKQEQENNKQKNKPQQSGSTKTPTQEQENNGMKKEQAEQILDALKEEEKKLMQQKMKKGGDARRKNEKDW
jgi:tetratricopeptide (TPR) repeat protein